MSTPSRRSAVAVLLVASVAVGLPTAVSVDGQPAAVSDPTGTATPTETAVGGGQTGTVGPGGSDATTEAEPEGATDDEQNRAFLRVAHVSPDAPAVDVSVDGERVLAGVTFGDVSEYLTVPAGNHTVGITRAGGDDTIFEGSLTLGPRSASTLFAAGEVHENAMEPFVPIVYEDDPFRPAADEAAVSVSHMSPDTPAVDVTADGGDVVLAENLTYEEASQYVTVPAGDYAVEFRAATPENDGPIVATAEVSLHGGAAYSAIAAGYLNDGPTEGEAFGVERVEDAQKTVHLPSSGDGAGSDEDEPANGTDGDGSQTATDGVEAEASFGSTRA